MAYPYKPPKFLEGQSANEVHRKMMNALPANIDKSEAQIPWDFTRPSALEKAELAQFEFNEVIKLIFPLWAYDEWLDNHAKMVGLARRAANKATGFVTVRAARNTILPRGFQFATPSVLTPSVLFETLAETVFIGTPGVAEPIELTIPIQAAEGGKAGNVAADTIKLMAKPLQTVYYVTNDDATTGGTEQENDDDLRERILEAIRYGISWVGCDKDYVRWGKEVPGVGQVVVDPEWDDPNMPTNCRWQDREGIWHMAGAVRLFIIDANGIPANQQILDAVYEHIVSPDDRLKRLAPIGATVTVVAPFPIQIDVEALVLLKEDENMDTVTERFKERLNTYWIQAATERSVKYVYVGSALAKTPGVSNYLAASLAVNGGMEDISIALGEFPVTGEVTLSG